MFGMYCWGRAMGDETYDAEFRQCSLGGRGSEIMAFVSVAAEIEDSSIACHVLQIHETILIQTHP